jgi:hypothetical protein
LVSFDSSANYQIIGKTCHIFDTKIQAILVYCIIQRKGQQGAGFIPFGKNQYETLNFGRVKGSQECSN